MTAHSLEHPDRVLTHYCWGWLLHCVFMLFRGDVVADYANLPQTLLDICLQRTCRSEEAAGWTIHTKLGRVRLCIKVYKFHFCCSDKYSDQSRNLGGKGGLFWPMVPGSRPSLRGSQGRNFEQLVIPHIQSKKK